MAENLGLKLTAACPFSSVICLVSEAIFALAWSLSLVKRASASSFSFCEQIKLIPRLSQKGHILQIATLS